MKNINQFCLIIIFKLQNDLPRLAEIDKALAIFVLATYGEGDPTDNAQELYDYIQQGQCDLNELNYAVISLFNYLFFLYN